MVQRYLASLIRWRWILVISTILAAGITYWIAKDLPILYVARSSLIVGPGIDNSNPDLNDLRAGGQLMQTYAELPTTAPFLQDIIDELDLDKTPSELLDIIEIQSSDVNQFLRFEVTYDDPEVASAIASTLARNLVRLSPSNPENASSEMEDLIRRQITITEQSIASAEARIQQIESDLSEMERQDAPLFGSLGTAESFDLAEARLKEFENRLQSAPDQESKVQESIQILEGLRDDTAQRILSLENDLDATSDVSIQELIIDQLASERSHLSNVQQTLIEIQRPINSLTLLQTREIQAAREDQVLEQIAEERDQLSEMQKFDVQLQIVYLDQLSEQRNLLHELNQTLSSLYESLHEATTNQVRIIETGENVEPKPAWLFLKVLAAGAAGMLLSAMLVIGLDYLSDTVETRVELEALTGRAVLGTISQPKRWLRKQREELVMVVSPDSVSADQYRMLSTKLLLTRQSNPVHSIVVTSVEPKQNATVVAANLAVALSHTGRKVYFIDANPHASELNTYFDCEGSPGLKEILSGSLEDVALPDHDTYPNLAVIPVHVSASEAFKLLSSANMSELIAEIAELGGVVIVNGPSLLASADSLYLSSQVDGVVLVAALADTRQKTVRRVVDNLSAYGVPLIGSVVIGKQNGRSGERPKHTDKEATESESEESDELSETEEEVEIESDVAQGQSEYAEPDSEKAAEENGDQDDALNTDSDVSAVGQLRSNIRGSSLLLIGRILAMGMNFGVQVFTVRYLSKSDYGAFAYALSVVAMTVMIAQFGLDKAIVRFVPIFHEKNEYKKMFGTIMMILGVIIGIGSAIILLTISLRGFLTRTVIDDPLAVSLLLFLIILTPINALDNVLQGLMAVFAKPRAIFLRRHILGPGLKLAAVLVVIVARSSVFILAVGYLIGGLLGLIVYIRMLMKVLRDSGLLGKISLGEIEMPAREIFRYSIPLLSSDVVAIARTTMVVVLLEYFSNTTSVAEYRAIVPLAGLNLVGLQSFKYLYTPLASRMFARKDKTGINKLYWQTAVWIAVITFPVFILSFLLAQPIVVLLFGERYASSGIFLALLAFGNYFNAALGFNTYSLRVYGRVGYIVLADVLTTLAGLGLSLLLIPRHGALGAAISASSTLVIYNLLNHVGLALRTGIDLFQRKYLRVYLSLIASGLALYGIQELLSPSVVVSIGMIALVSIMLLLINWRILDIVGMFPELARLPVMQSRLGSRGVSE